MSTVYEVAIEGFNQVQQPTHEITAALMTVHPRRLVQYNDYLEGPNGLHYPLHSATRKLVAHLHRLVSLQYSSFRRLWFTCSYCDVVIVVRPSVLYRNNVQMDVRRPKHCIIFFTISSKICFISKQP